MMRSRFGPKHPSVWVDRGGWPLVRAPAYTGPSSSTARCTMAICLSRLGNVAGTVLRGSRQSRCMEGSCASHFVLDASAQQERPLFTPTPAGSASSSNEASSQPQSGRRWVKPVPASTGAVTAQTLEDHAGMFSSLLYEYEYWVDPQWIEGQIPPELSGTYLRNGPGLQVNNERCQRHMFDGDGMLLSIAFKNGQAYFQNKFVRTKGFVAEQAAGKLLFRNSFTRGAVDGSAFWNPLDLRFKNVANTGVLHWAGRLFALWEVGLPYEVNPKSLETIGESSLNGQLAAGRMAAHHRTTYEADGSKRLVAFSTNVTLSGSTVSFYEFAESGKRLHCTSVPLTGVDVSFVHDMLVSEHYYIVVIGPIRFDFGRFAKDYMRSKCSIAECLNYDEGKKTKVMLFPRPGRPDGQVVKACTLETQPFFSFHHVNAYELDGGRRVVLDTIAWDEVAFAVTQYNVTLDHFDGGARSEYYRLVCDLDSATVSATRLVQRTLEFPALNPAFNGKPNRHAYLAADTVDHPVLWGPGSSILKVTAPPEGDLSDGNVELDMWYPGPRQCVGEPVFIPRPDGNGAEDAGWLITVVHDAAAMKAKVHILDAARVSDGPVCTLHLPHHLPAGLHGTFTSAYLGPDPSDQARARWKQPNIIKQL